MHFNTLTELTDHYKRLRRQAHSHAPVITYADPADRLGFWNPVNQVYDWYQCKDNYTYIQTGSTLKRGRIVWKSKADE